MRLDRVVARPDTGEWAGIPLLKTPHLEIAHVLFVDMVGYSKLRREQQAEVQETLTNLVNGIGEVVGARQESSLIARPTGDGMSLLFLRNLLSPLVVALEIDRILKRINPGLKRRIGTEIHLRMGIHTGPILILHDINGAMDVAGEGIVQAQRVMDAGDAGHILLSAQVVEGLTGMQPWGRFVHPLGPYHDKNGQRIDLYTLVGQMPGFPSFGREDAPRKVREDRARVRQQREQTSERLDSLVRADGYRSYWRSAALFCSVVLVVSVLGAVWYRSSQETFCDYFRVPGCFVALLPKTAPRPSASPVAAYRSPVQEGNFFPRVTSPLPSPSRRRTTIPSVLGKTFSEAQTLLEARGLRVDYVEGDALRHSTTMPSGLLLRQIPPAGRQALLGTIVHVVESSGPPDAPEDVNEEDDASSATAPAVRPTGFVIDVRNSAEFDPRGPLTIFSSDHIELNSGADYSVYEQFEEEEQRIRGRVGIHPFLCGAAVENHVSLILSAEASRQWDEIKAIRGAVPIAILCRKR